MDCKGKLAEADFGLVPDLGPKPVQVSGWLCRESELARQAWQSRFRHFFLFQACNGDVFVQWPPCVTLLGFKETAAASRLLAVPTAGVSHSKADEPNIHVRISHQIHAG